MAAENSFYKKRSRDLFPGISGTKRINLQLKVFLVFPGLIRKAFSHRAKTDQELPAGVVKRCFFDSPEAGFL
jgi:hypothetical protein